MTMRGRESDVQTEVNEPAKPADADLALWRRPYLSRLLRSRSQCLLIPLVFAGYGLLHVLGFGFWRCPLQWATGRPCPGCGLTRAVLAGLQGDWAGMVQYHPFAPVLGGLFAGLLVLGLLPNTWREAVADRLERVEYRCAPVAIFAVVFILWALLRAIGLVSPPPLT
jgi:hypothetical protein